MEESVSAISEMNNGIIEFNKNLNEANLLTNGIGESLKTIAKWTGAAAISLGLQDMVSSLMKINEEATKSAVILGKKAFGKELKENIRDISKNITNLQKEIGVSTEKAKELTNTFLKARITENLHDATAAAAMFERATGAATEDVVSMYNEMYHGAKMSTESVNSVMAALSKTQHTLGLTENGMKSVVKTAGNMAIQLRGFGATDKQIQNMTVSLGKYASAMENVGVSAQEATAWVEQLTNPDNIEKNIGLYAQMGISMTDALQGNFDGIQQGEQELAQRIVDMGPIAGAAYAKEFGYSYSKAMKTVNLEAPGQVDIDPQEQAMDSLKQMSEEVLGITGKIEKTFNQLKGRLLALGPAILTAIGVVVALAKTKIFPKAKKSIADVVAGGIQEGIEGAKIGAGFTGLFKNNFNKANKDGSGYNAADDLTKIFDTIKQSGDTAGKNFKDTFGIYFTQLKQASFENAKEEQKQQVMLRIQKGKNAEAELEELKRMAEKFGENIPTALSNRITHAEQHVKTMKTSAYDLFNSGDKKYKTSAVKEIALAEKSSKLADLKAQQKSAHDLAEEIKKQIRIANDSSGKDREDAMSFLKEKTGLQHNEVENFLKNQEKAFEDLRGASQALKDATDEEGLKGKINDVQGQYDSIKNENNLEGDPKQRSFLARMVMKPFDSIKNKALSIKSGVGDWVTNASGLSSEEATTGKRVRRAIGNTVAKGAVKGVAGLGKLAKSIGKLGLKMGVMGIVANLLKPLIDMLKTSLAPVLEDLQTQIGEVFQDKAFKDFINCVVNLAKDLVPIVMQLFKAFMPIIKVLMDIIIKLVNFLLPPILWVLGKLLSLSGLLLEGLGHLPGLGALKDVGKEIRDAGHNMVDLSHNFKANTEASQENTEAVKSNSQDQAAQMRVTSTYGTTSLVERGAAYSVDNSTAETAGAVNNLNKNMTESSKASESAREEQRAVNETIVQSNYDIKQAINRILDRIEGTSGRVQVQMPNS
jgi:hypothetical protein